METDPKDQSRGMAPSEMMRKVSAIDPMGLLGDPSDNDQEMREVEDGGATPDADPAIHKNVHVISASEGEGSECGMQGDGSEPDTNNATAANNTAAIKEKGFIIVDIERPATLSAHAQTAAEPADLPPLQSASTLMPPPPARTPQAATANPVTSASVPDPATIKRIFQQAGAGGPQNASTQQLKNSGQEKNCETQNEKTDSGSSKNSETSGSKTALPKIKPTAVEADLTKKTKRRWAPLVASPPARTQLNVEVFTIVPTTALPAQFTKKTLCQCPLPP
jgi:hypothetical protein